MMNDAIAIILGIGVPLMMWVYVLIGSLEDMSRRKR